ncbi:MAG: TauD/TfdA family dioxygenase [Ilumatobacteraceae bacterium]
MTLDVDGALRHFSWTWLRDHARDPSSYHAAAHQRLVPADVVAAVGRGTAAVDAGVLVVTWPDAAAEFGADLLAAMGSPAEMYGEVGRSPEPWSGAELADRLERLDHRELVETEDGRRRALDGFGRDGVIVVTDVPLDLAATRAVLERFGYVRRTLFGDVWEYGSDGALDDTASTSLEIGPHTDGTYSNDAPGLLGLHCWQHAAEGGESVVVDGCRLAARLGAAEPDAFEVLCTTDVPGQYIGDGVHLVARRPVLRHEGGRLVQVSFNHHDRAPFVLPEPTMRQLFDALHRFDRITRQADNTFALSLRRGDMLLLDNWRVLHARRAFSGERRFAGGYVNREDIESTMRLTRSGSG